MPYDATIVKKFWERVAVCEHGLECPDCCWPWLGALANGYGTLSVYDRERYAPRNFRANRLACEIATETFLPHGLWALHKCNVPACCHYHPAHVYIGTPQDNAYDTLRAGHHITQQASRHNSRGPGSRPHASHEFLWHRRGAKLTPDVVRRIRFLAQAGLPVNALVKIFGFSNSHTSAIILRQRWGHVE